MPGRSPAGARPCGSREGSQPDRVPLAPRVSLRSPSTLLPGLLDCADPPTVAAATARGTRWRVDREAAPALTDAEVRDRAVNRVVLDIIVVLAIVLVGGFFAGAEMALVSLREGQVRRLRHRGRRGQRAARLAQDPNRFLSSVQIGVTVATLLSGAFGAATLADALKSALIAHNVSTGWASTISLIAVTGVISFFTLVLGELAPKRLALQRPESLSLIAAPVLDRISMLARPLVWLLSRSTNLVVRLLGGDPAAGRGVMTEEELRDLVAGNQALSADERHIVREVFDAGKRQLREVLVPRTEVEFIAAATPLERAAKIAAAAPYSRFPVYQESYDNIIGFIHVRDLLTPGLAGRPVPVGELVRPVKRLPISKR